MLLYCNQNIFLIQHGISVEPDMTGWGEGKRHGYLQLGYGINFCSPPPPHVNDFYKGVQLQQMKLGYRFSQ